MKKSIYIAVLGLLLTSVHVHAEDDKKTPPNTMTAKAQDEKKHAGSQQEKMKRCNVEAKGMKGDERKAKMSACLKG